MIHRPWFQRGDRPKEIHQVLDIDYLAEDVDRIERAKDGDCVPIRSDPSLIEAAMRDAN